jgi:hypothetical protein
MPCERYHDALTDVAAGAVAPAEVEAHLASCEGCRHELAALRKALALADAGLAGLLAAEPSPGLPARIREAVAESAAAPAWRFGWLWPVAAAAATLLVAFAVWVGRAPSPEPRVAVEQGGAVTPRDSRPPGERSEALSAPAGASARRGSPAAVPSSPRGGVTGRDSVVAAPGRRSAPAVRAAPEVLVPRGEAEALVRFATIVHRDRHAPGAFLAVDRPSTDLAEPPDLAVTPLEIAPLDPAENQGT